MRLSLTKNESISFILKTCMFLKTLWYGSPILPIPDPDGWGVFLYYVLSVPVIVVILLLKVILYLKIKNVRIFIDPLLFILCLVAPLLLPNYGGGPNWLDKKYLDFWMLPYGGRYILFLILVYGYFVDISVLKKWKNVES